MKHPVTRALAVLMALLMLLSAVAVAEESTDGGLYFPGMEPTKKAVRAGGVDKWEVTLSVPGTFATDKYNEIIVMVDASTSQSGNFGNLKNLIIGLAEDVLSNDSTMRLTLMGFGIGPRYAGSFYTVDQVRDFLATATQDDLLQGRSATNCEVGFEFVNRYISGSSNLEHAIVVYTSDGAVNYAENPIDWTKWNDDTVFDYFQSYTKKDVVEFIVGLEADMVAAGRNPQPATFAKFPAQAIAVSMAKLTAGVESDAYKAAAEALGTALAADAEGFISRIVQAVFAYSNMDATTASVSDAEKAFMTYYRAHVDAADFDSYMNIGYLLMGNGTMTDKAERAAAASVALQNNSKVAKVYHVGYTGASSTWMNPEKGYNVDAGKLKYVYNTDFGSVAGDLQSMTDEMIVTAYYNVTVTDPMSDYVTLDESTIRIYNDETKIWENGAWLTDDQPTENPITVTADENNGKQTITWKIKDAPLLHTDRYNLRYVVTVKEEGTVIDKNYPANDYTYFTYNDGRVDGELKKQDISVPKVNRTELTGDIPDVGMGLRIFKEALGTSAPLSDITFRVYKVVPDEGVVLEAVPTEEDVAHYGVEANLVATMKTDALGFAAAELEEGIYMVVEEASDKVVAPADPFYFNLPMTNPETGKPMNIVEVHPKNTPVETEPTPPGPVEPDEPTPDTTGTFSIVKVDATNTENKLSGAQFQVMRAANEGEVGDSYTCNGQTLTLVPVVDAEGNPVIITTDENGAATSPELPVGMYFLYEVKAPDGYNMLEDVIPVYATQDGGAIAPTTVENAPGAQLPSTGGMGTQLFLYGGLALMVVAMLLAIYKRQTA